MNTSKKSSDTRLTVSTDSVAHGAPARKSTSGPIVEKWRTSRFSMVSARTDESFEEEAIDPGRSPEDIAAAREAYGRLSPQEQQVVRMHTEGWSYREIGVAIGCKGECVRVIYRGAIEQMREILK